MGSTPIREALRPRTHTSGRAALLRAQDRKTRRRPTTRRHTDLISWALEEARVSIQFSRALHQVQVQVQVQVTKELVIVSSQFSHQNSIRTVSDSFRTERAKPPHFRGRQCVRGTLGSSRHSRWALVGRMSQGYYDYELRLHRELLKSVMSAHKENKEMNSAEDELELVLEEEKVYPGIERLTDRYPPSVVKGKSGWIYHSNAFGCLRPKASFAGLRFTSSKRQSLIHSSC